MRDLLIPVPLAALLAQAGSNVSDWPTLVKEFGTWVIWLLIAAYMFRRSEKRDESANAERLEIQKEILKLHKENSEEQKRLMMLCTSAIQNSNRYMKAMVRAMGTSKCINFKPPTPKEESDTEES